MNDGNDMIFDVDDTKIGENIKEIINKLGYSQKEVCEGSGIQQSVLSRIVTGKVGGPNQKSIKKIANFLNVPIDSFYSGEIRDVELYNKFMNDLPKELAEAFTDVRNREYLLFGLEVKECGLSLEEVRNAIKYAKLLKNDFIKKVY